MLQSGPMDGSDKRKPNRLVTESSPYLQQHAYNPVDWFPWGPEAQEKAQRDDKPILLSIGYSACHWCHVMEYESFEDEEIAALMNGHFINIKVDREERPDIDSIYMNYVQMSTGSGGWPLTVFLTPDRVPFYGGTYFPPRDKYGRPGFLRVLESIADAYRTQQDKLQEMQPELLSRLEKAARFDVPESEPEAELLEEAYTTVRRHFDGRYGGFGSAPKFPSSMVLGFLLRYQLRIGSEAALEMVEKSLVEMSRGGLYDVLGGGFHRYSVDDQWLVPHFEKMLYDNALLARVYLEVFQVTGKETYAEVATSTLEYVQREMTNSEGGFYSSQDADSEGEEGRFYVWSAEEIQHCLSSEEAGVFCDFYGVSPAGNFEGKNILHQNFDLAGFPRRAGLPLEELRTILAQSRARLLKERNRRVKPGTDEKVLAAWNGMMLSAFSQASFVLNRPDFLATAEHNASFLASEMMKDGRLFRSWKDGKARLNGYVEDYAAVVEGFLNLFSAGSDVRWLIEAEKLMETQFEHFWDSAGNDFYFTASDHEKLLLRQKEYLDNATPSGNSTSCLNLLRLAEFSGKEVYRERAHQMLRQMGLAASQHPLAFGNWLQALDFMLGPVDEIAIIGPQEGREAMIPPVRRHFLPNSILVQTLEVTPNLEEKIPLLRGKAVQPGQTKAFVCRAYSCRQPVSSAAELEKQLSSSAQMA